MLPLTIDELVRQSNEKPSIEIAVWDDGSTDDNTLLGCEPLSNLPGRRSGRPVFFFESAAAIPARTFDGFAVTPRSEKCGSLESITAELLPDNQYFPGRR